MLCGVTKHLPAHSLTAGEKYKIELLVQKCLILRSSSPDHRHIFGGKALSDHFFHDSASGRGIGAGLQDDRVAGGDCVGQGIQGQKKGIIPGTHNQHIPIGHRLPEAVGRKLCQRGVHPFSLCKFSYMPQHIGNFGKHQTAFTHKAFVRAFP